MVIGLYVGFATVGVFAYWYIWYDWAEYDHTLVTWSQLTSYQDCPSWTNFTAVMPSVPEVASNPCAYFTEGKVVASTLSLSVLVTIEMLNALNALSEDGSLLQMPPWANPWLLVAMAVSFGLHFLILYVTPPPAARRGTTCTPDPPFPRPTTLQVRALPGGHLQHCPARLERLDGRAGVQLPCHHH